MNGEELKRKRLEMGLTQKELAEKTQLNLYTIQNLEQGTRKGSKLTWERINGFFENRDVRAIKYIGRKIKCTMYLDSYDDDVVVVNTLMSLEDFKNDLYNYLAHYNKIEILEDNIELYKCEVKYGLSAIINTEKYFWSKGNYRYDTLLTKDEIIAELEKGAVAVEGLGEITSNDIDKL